MKTEDIQQLCFRQIWYKINIAYKIIEDPLNLQLKHGNLLIFRKRIYESNYNKQPLLDELIIELLY